MRPMPSDPRALHKGTREVVLTTMALPFSIAVCHAAWLGGVAVGEALTPYLHL